VQALRIAGDTLTDTFTYTIRDAAGATSGNNDFVHDHWHNGRTGRRRRHRQRD
jgi:hypothetical protein